MARVAVVGGVGGVGLQALVLGKQFARLDDDEANLFRVNLVQRAGTVLDGAHVFSRNFAPVGILRHSPKNALTGVNVPPSSGSRSSDRRALRRAAKLACPRQPCYFEKFKPRGAAGIFRTAEIIPIDLIWIMPAQGRQTVSVSVRHQNERTGARDERPSSKNSPAGKRHHRPPARLPKSLPDPRLRRHDAGACAGNPARSLVQRTAGAGLRPLRPLYRGAAEHRPRRRPCAGARNLAGQARRARDLPGPRDQAEDNGNVSDELLAGRVRPSACCAGAGTARWSRSSNSPAPASSPKR